MRNRDRALRAERAAIALLALLAIVGAPTVAAARPGMHTLRIDGGGAVMVTQPQSSRFDFGGGVGLGYELAPIPYLGVGARFSMFWFPSTSAAPTVDGYGATYAPALEVRVHPLAGLDLGDLWVVAAGSVAITGEVVRPGLELGAGYEIQIVDWLRAGPFVRYHHVFETEGLPGAADAGFLSFGASIGLLGDAPPDLDRDDDGIEDVADRCPDEPEDLDSFEDADGCPDRDDDQDGVLDTDDRCRLEPEDADGFEDGDGCPDPDDDHDGIADASDACPREAEDADGFEDQDGCPDLDNDGDGIADAADACRDQAEVVNGYEDGDGCPDEVPEAERELDRLGHRIQFPHNRVRIEPSSRAALERVAQLLRESPAIRRLRVEAHASAEGSSEYNHQLSERRAQRVIEELVARGVERERLEAHPLGDTQPLDAEDTPEAHALNRRVEFVVVERAR